MICPKCKSNLEGGLIYESFLTMYEGTVNPKAKALDAAAMYGATPTKGRWGREIGIYDMGEDRTVAWRCPDCNHEWPR